MGATRRKSATALTMKVPASFLVIAFVLPAIVHGSDWQDGWIAGWKSGWNQGWNFNSQGQPRGTLAPKKSTWETWCNAGESAGYWEGRQASENYFGTGIPRTPGFHLAGIQAGQNIFGQGQGQLFTAGLPLLVLPTSVTLITLILFLIWYQLSAPLPLLLSPKTKVTPKLLEATKLLEETIVMVEGFVLGSSPRELRAISSFKKPGLEMFHKYI